MNMNFNIFKPYKERLQGAGDEYGQQLYESEVDQDEFSTRIADDAVNKVDNYHELQGLLKRHPELKDEKLFKNIKQQYKDLLHVDYRFDFNVDHFNNIWVDFDEQESEMQKNGVDDGVKLDRKAM